MDSLTIAIGVCILFIVYSFVMSVSTKNYSQVDKLWSIVPIVYVFVLSGYSPKGWIRKILVCFWGIRLTYNFKRRGGYSGVEDYRWEHVKKMIPNPVLWELFNIFFICISQHVILLLLVLPAYMDTNTGELNYWEYFFAFMICVCLAIEIAADQQQWNFQTEKYRKIDKKETLTGDYKRGFLTSGLFAYSRHPNYIGEIGIWWNFYFFSNSYDFSFIGVLLLTILFFFSTRLTEEISQSKYPEYEEYKKKVRMFF